MPNPDELLEPASLFIPELTVGFVKPAGGVIPKTDFA
jgi:hypothetical protein